MEKRRRDWSADDLDLISPEALAGSLATYLSIFRILENDTLSSSFLKNSTINEQRTLYLNL